MQGRVQGLDPSANPMLALVEFIRRTTAQEDSVLAALHSAIRAANMPSVTPEAGKLLYLLAKVSGARRILEVGTGFGYSTIWMGRALPPGGELTSIEADPEHARIAGTWLARAGLQDRVRIAEGKAAGVIPALPTKYFDMVFIDADKQGYPQYWELAMRHVRAPGLVCADNAFWFGAALDERDASPDAEGVRAYNRLAASTPGVETLLLPLGDGLSVSFRS